jgi:uncharacterized membrane protein
MIGVFVWCAGVVGVSAQQRKDFGLSQTVAATGNLIPTKIAGADNVPQLIGSIVAGLLGTLGFIFFFLIFYAGLVWMTAQGNEEKIERSKEIISAAVIGLVIVLAAYALTQFVFDQLGVKGSNTASSVSSNSSAGTPSGSAIVCGDFKDFAACNSSYGADGKPTCDWVSNGTDMSVGTCVKASGY